VRIRRLELARGVLDRRLRMYGIDVVSTPHIAIDWTKVRESGRTFAYVRAANGRVADPGFAATWDAMHRAGIVCGAGHVLHHDQDPVEQAVTFLKQVHLERGDLPPTLDLELLATASPTAVRSLMHVWISIIESELDARHGCTLRPIIRTSSRARPLHGERGSFARHPLWVIDPSRFDPPTVPACWGDGEWTLHQYAVGRHGVPGTACPVQLDRFQPCALGDRGRRVAHVKQLLRSAGFGFGVPETAELDHYTHQALLQFQASRGLLEDGIVGPKTFAELHWPAV
jgi:lysozyme